MSLSHDVDGAVSTIRVEILMTISSLKGYDSVMACCGAVEGVAVVCRDGRSPGHEHDDKVGRV